MAYYASANIPEAEALISVIGPETACTAFASTAAVDMPFQRWDLICDYCGRVLFSTTSNSFTRDLTQYYSEQHPGPFHLLAIYKSNGPNQTTVHVLEIDFEQLPHSDSQPTIPESNQPAFYTSYGVKRYIPRGGMYQDDVYVSNAFIEYSSWDPFTQTSDYNHRTFYISAVIRPRVGFRFVKFIFHVYYHEGSVKIDGMFSYSTQTMSDGSYRIQVTRVGNITSHPSDVDLKIYAIYEYTGAVNLTIKAVPRNYGTIDVVGDDGYFVARRKDKAIVENLRQWDDWPTDNGPSFDFDVTANDGVVKFLRWSDGEPRAHRFTITEYGQALIAYFSEGLLIYDENNEGLLLYETSSNSLMYENTGQKLSH